MQRQWKNEEKEKRSFACKKKVRSEEILSAENGKTFFYVLHTSRFAWCVFLLCFVHPSEAEVPSSIHGFQGFSAFSRSWIRWKKGEGKRKK
jgi:hypothetical protein